MKATAGAARRFVVIGQRALADGGFRMQDLPGTSGRLDALLRCVRSALLFSHGLRRDTLVDLVLLGGPRAPRVLRFAGEAARYVRPDERSLAIIAQRALALPAGGPGFLELRPGVWLGEGGLELVCSELGESTLYVLEEAGRDIREVDVSAGGVFFVGDDRGFAAATRATLDALGASPLSVGPVSVHAEDAIAVLVNELDRARERALEPPLG